MCTGKPWFCFAFQQKVLDQSVYPEMLPDSFPVSGSLFFVGGCAQAVCGSRAGGDLWPAPGGLSRGGSGASAGSSELPRKRVGLVNRKTW